MPWLFIVRDNDQEKEEMFNLQLTYFQTRDEANNAFSSHVDEAVFHSTLSHIAFIFSDHHKFLKEEGKVWYWTWDEKLKTSFVSCWIECMDNNKCTVDSLYQWMSSPLYDLFPFQDYCVC